eukprot:1076315-Prorocentrum_lima.AAC.1
MIGHRKLYMCDHPDDITITIRLGPRDVHVLQLVQALAGHLLLLCTDYAKMARHKNTVNFTQSS